MTTSSLQGSGSLDPYAPAPAGPAGPTADRHPRKGYLFFLGFAAIGTGMAQLVPAVLTLSIKSTAITPADPTGTLSVVVAVGALCSLVALPVFGRLSDRTTSRLGRRRPYLLLGAAFMALGAVATLLAGTVLALVLAGVATSIGVAATLVAATATVPDLLAPERRGPASALLGLSLPVGAVVGLFIAQAVSPNLAAMILVPAGIGVLGSVVFAVVSRDRRISAAERPVLDRSQVLSTFWVNPVRNRDFAMAWWSRLLVFLGVAAVQAYQAFYLVMVLHFTPETVAGAIFLSTLVLTGVSLLLAPVMAKVSDRIGRRKPFVVVAALVFAVGLALVAGAHSFPAFLLAMGVMGIGQGVYFAVDLALITQLLPDPANPAKDLGLMNLASSLPGAVVPALAPFVLAIGASASTPQNFTALFVLGAVAALLGAVLITPIRSVK